MGILVVMAHFRQFSSARGRFSYLLTDVERREALLIDPDDTLGALYLGVLDELQARLGLILLTHTHAGRGVPGSGLQAATGAQLAMAEPPASSMRALEDGEALAFGDEVLRTWRTPGHTRNSSCFFWRDRVFTGDALLIGDCGSAREADSDPGSLFDSLSRRLLTLPDETLVYPAHDFAGRCVSCIGEQRRSNPKLKDVTRDEFVALYYRDAANNPRQVRVEGSQA